MKKIVALVVIAVIIILFLPNSALADGTYSSGGLDEANAVEVDLASGGNGSGTLQLSGGGYYKIMDSATTQRDVQIVCLSNDTHLIVSTITVVSLSGCALSFTGTENELLLDGSSSFTSGYREPGIRVEGSTWLTIDDADGTTGSILAYGGENSAGIGGGNYSNAGNITISGGTISLAIGGSSMLGGDGGAGIGGGCDGSGGNILISGGTIQRAEGGDGGAGIGGGNGGSGGTIVITGGAITLAQGGDESGDSGGAGIGGGSRKNGGSITISGGTVTSARGGGYAAGIGGGYMGSGGNIAIEGTAQISSAQGGEASAGIGGGAHGSGGVINISGGSISAIGGSYIYGGGAGIGGGGLGGGAAGTITISDGTIVKAQGGNYQSGDFGGAGIGGGFNAYGGAISISGGTITESIGGDGGAGIGSGDDGTGGTITITGGNIKKAQGSAYDSGYGSGAGIGGGRNSTVGTIEISGGTIDLAQGSEYGGAGIGGGESNGTGTITISGGILKSVLGSDEAAGIGSGMLGSAISIIISGGTITDSLGGNNAAGIGAGSQSLTSNITISGSAYIETAKGGDKGAGIGGGYDCGGGTINISDCTIDNALGGSQGAGIGGGYHAGGGNITINSAATINKAQGGDKGAGIGGGYMGSGGIITIEGGTITSAQGGGGGAGIGGGEVSSGGTITISGGAKVYAKAGSNAEDIGKGYSGVSSGSLEISDASTVVFTSNTAEFSGATLNNHYFTTDVQIMSDTRVLHSIDTAPWNTAGGLYCATYYLSYNGNANTGGTAPTDGNSPYVSGSTVTVLDNPTSPNTLTRTGYDFMGWNTESTNYSSGAHYNAGETFAITTVTTLYAEWEANQATISYDDNNGSGGESGTRTATFDIDMPTPIVLPTRTGYNFAGYYDAVSGGTQYYTNTGASARTWDKVVSTFMLYAQWTVGTYDVVFDANGGSGSMTNQSIIYGQSENLDSNSFTRVNYTFDGWNTEEDGSGTSYNDGVSYTMNSEGETLYAQWLGDPCTITYDNNGGSGTISSQNSTYGETVVLSDGVGFSYEGYVLESWDIGSLGGLYDMTGDVAAYAVWAVDTDKDGISDDDENAAGTDPNSAQDKPETETVKIHLEYNDGTDASGYTFVLNSTPKEGTTNSSGNVVFTNVSLSPHTLSLRNGTTEVANFTLSFTEADTNSATIIGSGTGVSATNTSDFLSLELVIRLNTTNSSGSITEADIRLRANRVGNPKTAEY